ncbi:hypothetical protein AUJ15_00425 [Candidatus Micrarchaeota archaeon CG1_02_55_41]|nr:MAG: hypothetical protein AUJ15_00425 [Candidatus Micrarchaeota archaeon CG1_02_55_41]
MVDKKFYLISQKSNLQRIGLRAQIVSFLIANSIDKGNALNDLTNKQKVIVAINFESKPPNSEIDIATIAGLKTELLEYLNGLSQADSECYASIPNDITAGELVDLNNPHPVAVLDLQKLSASLMLEQTSKGVGAMLNLSKTIKPLHELAPSINSLTKQIEQLNEHT